MSFSPVPDGFYQEVGGHETFRRLVDRFYEGVAGDPLLIGMYPEGMELEGAKHRLRTFLEQYFGGPKTYGEERGHPRLRMRHAPFPVTPAAREAWLRHMEAAMDSLDLPPLHRQIMGDYFERAATAMVNSFDEATPAPAAEPEPGPIGPDPGRRRLL